MKRHHHYYYFLAVFLCGLLGLTGSVLAETQPKGIKWLTYEQGLAAGKKEGKKIFIHFYANWCGYCRTMEKKTFQNADIIGYMNKNFIPIKVNTDKEQSTAMKYGVRGLPSNWFLENNGDKIGNRPGFIAPEDLIVFLEFIHTDSFKKMTFQAFSEARGK